MKKPMTFALAIMVACSVWLFAEKREAASGTYLVTRFDFARYPACQQSGNSNCILAIRFYDADSNQRLVEVKNEREDARNAGDCRESESRCHAAPGLRRHRVPGQRRKPEGRATGTDNGTARTGLRELNVRWREREGSR